MKKVPGLVYSTSKDWHPTAISDREPAAGQTTSDCHPPAQRLGRIRTPGIDVPRHAQRKVSRGFKKRMMAKGSVLKQEPTVAAHALRARGGLGPQCHGLLRKVGPGGERKDLQETLESPYTQITQYLEHFSVSACPKTPHAKRLWPDANCHLGDVSRCSELLAIY